MELETYIKNKILVLDGAIGTAIQELDLTEADFRGARFIDFPCGQKGNHDILSITRPQIIKNIHCRYLDAGAAVIGTNTFNANNLSQSNFHMQGLVYEMNYQSARLAVETARQYHTDSRPRFVAGVIGPAYFSSNEGGQPGSNSKCFETFLNAYEQQIKGLAEGGVDLFLVETVTDPIIAKAAIQSIKKYCQVLSRDIPVMISASIDLEGRLPSGKTISDFIDVVSGYPVFSAGLNCCPGTYEITRYLKLLSSNLTRYTSFHPFSGLPGKEGKHNLSPVQFARMAEEVCGMGLVNIIGGCCGTTPEHIEAVSQVVRKYPPRKPPVNIKKGSPGVKGVEITSPLSNNNLKNRAASQAVSKFQFSDTPGRKGNYLSIREAREKRYQPDWEAEKPVKPGFLGVKVLDSYPLEEIKKHIDWTSFFNGWGMKGKYPEILRTGEKGREARRIFREAGDMLEEIIKRSLVRAKGVIGLYPANSAGDDIIVFKDESRKEPLMVLPMLRQQRIYKNQSRQYCLSDYMAPLSSGIPDYIGTYSVTAGLGADKPVDSYSENGDHYESIMFRFVCDRLTEAFAEILHMKVRKEYWGYSRDENTGINDLLKGKFPGIRPAPGYPSCPDHLLKKHIFTMLGGEENTEITLTTSYAMSPASSTTGFYFGYRKAKYFGVGKVLRDQVEDYAERMGLSAEETERWLGSLLGYKNVAVE